MALVSTDRLSVFWNEGVLPIKQDFLAYRQASRNNIIQLQEEINALKANGIPNSGEGGDAPIIFGGGAITAYIRKNGEEFASDWLGESPTSLPLTPKENTLYVVISSGKYENRLYRWDADEEEYVAIIAEEQISEEDIEEIINSYVIPTVDLEDGFSPVITEDENNNANVYRLNITTKTGTFTTPNLIGNIDIITNFELNPEDNHLYFNGNKIMFTTDVSEEVVNVPEMISDALTELETDN